MHVSHLITSISQYMFVVTLSKLQQIYIIQRRRITAFIRNTLLTAQLYYNESINEQLLQFYLLV